MFVRKSNRLAILSPACVWIRITVETARDSCERDPRGLQIPLLRDTPALLPPNAVLRDAVRLLEVLDGVLGTRAEDTVDRAGVAARKLQQALHFLDG